jgi:FkbM family methyltransferase
MQEMPKTLIRAALRTAIKRVRKATTACWKEWGRTFRGAWRMARRVPTVEISGVQISINREFSSKVLAALYFGNYEEGDAKMISEKIAETDVVLEFGGGLGFVSTLCAKRIGSERVFCYEANPAMIQVIRATYKLNGVAPTLTQGLLGDNDGEAELFVGEHFDGASAVPCLADAKKVQVPAFAINPVIRRLRPTFLIMDIEGGERDLVPAIDFSGIQKMILELHPRRIGDKGMRRVRQCLTSAGFTVDTRLSGEKILFLEKLF